MALTIDNPRIDWLARRSAVLRDVSITEAIEAALERDVAVLETVPETEVQRRLAAIRRIQEEIAKAPVLDSRSTAEITDELDEDILASH